MNRKLGLAYFCFTVSLSLFVTALMGIVYADRKCIFNVSCGSSSQTCRPS